MPGAASGRNMMSSQLARAWTMTATMKSGPSSAKMLWLRHWQLHGVAMMVLVVMAVAVAVLAATVLGFNFTAAGTAMLTTAAM